MRKAYLVSRLFLTLALVIAAPRIGSGQGGFEPVTGKAFDTAMPKDFYLEGNAIPTEKRNAALVKTPAGARALFALIDTTGYSSEIKKKYIGMIITEGDLSVCDQKIGVGSYGFGLDRPEGNGSGDGTFFLYNPAGTQVMSCAAKKDAEGKRPRPLQVLPAKDGSARLYLGRYWLELK